MVRLHCFPAAPRAAAGQGMIEPRDVVEAVMFCFRLSKNAVPVSGLGLGGWAAVFLRALQARNTGVQQMPMVWSASACRQWTGRLACPVGRSTDLGRLAQIGRDAGGAPSWAMWSQPKRPSAHHMQEEIILKAAKSSK